MRSHFQCNADSVSDRKSAPEWELDVTLQEQLASFHASWNLVNSVLLVNHILGVISIALHEHALIDPNTYIQWITNNITHKFYCHSHPQSLSIASYLSSFSLNEKMKWAWLQHHCHPIWSGQVTSTCVSTQSAIYSHPFCFTITAPSTYVSIRKRSALWSRRGLACKTMQLLRESWGTLPDI